MVNVEVFYFIICLLFTTFENFHETKKQISKQSLSTQTLTRFIKTVLKSSCTVINFNVILKQYL